MCLSLPFARCLPYHESLHLNTHNKLANKNLGCAWEPDFRRSITLLWYYHYIYYLITVWAWIAVNGKQCHGNGHQNAHSKSQLEKKHLTLLLWNDRIRQRWKTSTYLKRFVRWVMNDVYNHHRDWRSGPDREQLPHNNLSIVLWSPKKWNYFICMSN